MSRPISSSNRDNIPELGSESDSDYDMRYTLPHYATPSREETSSTKKSPGTPGRPIKIPDVKSAGTPDEPIWISDVDGTDTETDASHVAVRGTRKTRPGHVHVPPSSAFQLTVNQQKSSQTPLSKDDKTAATKKKKETKQQQQSSSESKGAVVVLPPASSSPSKSPTKTPVQTRSRSPTKVVSHRSLKNASSEETPISTNITQHQQTTGESKVKSKNRIKTPTWRSKVSPNASQKVTAPSIDIASLAKEGEDPTLEKELEEIALNGRSGLISGTPAAYDIEKGKKESFPSYMPPLAASLDEDEADKSWHNPITDVKPKSNRRQKWYLLLAIAGLLAISGSLAYVLAGDNNEPEIMETEPELTQRQQTMQNHLERITDLAILNNPNTPQHKARRWLLFRDRDLVSMDEERIVQRFVLACFYFSTSGDEKWNENNWLSGDECGATPWKGLKCNDAGEVTAIVLDNQGLSGTIPIEIGHLMNLEHLILKNNPGLFGWIPTTLGHIQALLQIGLYKNALSGTIPDIFEHANQIRYINLEDNHMFGSIPMSIQRLTNLDTLALANNKFDGIVPVAQLAKTTLKYLNLSGNAFSGMLEHAIQAMTTVEHLYLDHNKLKGPIPHEISALTNLKSLDLGNNQFTGTVPTEIGILQRLEFLSMEQNKLKGTLPREVGLLTNLKSLNFASNQIGGTVPNISNMFRLVNLQLFENQLTGSIPEAVQQLQSIEIVSLSSNKLAGTIPRTITRLSRTLRGLYLSDNQIQGRIPTDLCGFSSLEALFLDSNKLFGPIPPCLGDLSQLQQLYLFGNQLSGQVPSTLGSLSQLTGLGIENNGITGEMPDGVCTLVDDHALDIWADCTDEFGSDPLLCDCCSVCCPSDDCQ